MAISTLTERISSIVGEAQTITDPELLAGYLEDMTECEPGRVDVVARPRSADEVRELVLLARSEGVPLTPAVARMNVGGLAIPTRGGIVVDLSDMTQVIELDRDHMYALIEPGVTFEQLTAHLRENAPELTLSYPLAPPWTSVVANFLLDGLGNLSLRHGAAGEQIGGVEVVLPDGTLARTGAGAISPVWFSRSPLPDLTGLFVNFHGATGIVTKMAVQLWPNPKLRRRLFIFSEELRPSWAMIRELARREICHDISGISWPTAKMLFGADRPLVNDPGEPELFIGCDVGGETEEEVAWKERTVREIVARHQKGGMRVGGIFEIGELIEVAPSLARFAEFPMTLDFLLEHPGRGLTWVGTYGPTMSWEEGADRCSQLMSERGYPPILVTRPMKGGHYGVLRMIALFDKSDPAEIERVRELNRDLLEICVGLGFVPYKAPAWAAEQMEDRTDPGFLELMGTVKRALDPDGIMAPGRWNL